MTRPMLHIENLRIDLGGQTILENINLDLAAGHSLALSGASGSGKTTLLRAIAGLAEPQEGRIENRARRLAYLYQEPRLLPWLRADENIRLVAPDASDELQQRIIRTIESGTSVVLVTHDAQEAVRLAQHIYCLGGKPAGIFAEIPLPEAFSARDHAWCAAKSAHPALRGIEEAALSD